MTREETIEELLEAHHAALCELVHCAPDDRKESKLALAEAKAAVLAAWPRPIPVSERLPEDNTEVLCYSRKTLSGFRRWHFGMLPRNGTNDDWFDPTTGNYSLNDVTHWLPLPPKNEPLPPTPE